MSLLWLCAQGPVALKAAAMYALRAHNDPTIPCCSCSPGTVDFVVVRDEEVLELPSGAELGKLPAADRADAAARRATIALRRLLRSHRKEQVGVGLAALRCAQCPGFQQAGPAAHACHVLCLSLPRMSWRMRSGSGCKSWTRGSASTLRTRR